MITPGEEPKPQAGSAGEVAQKAVRVVSEEDPPYAFIRANRIITLAPEEQDPTPIDNAEAAESSREEYPYTWTKMGRRRNPQGRNIPSETTTGRTRDPSQRRQACTHPEQATLVGASAVACVGAHATSLGANAVWDVTGPWNTLSRFLTTSLDLGQAWLAQNRTWQQQVQVQVRSAATWIRQACAKISCKVQGKVGRINLVPLGPHG